ELAASLWQPTVAPTTLPGLSRVREARVGARTRADVTGEIVDARPTPGPFLFSNEPPKTHRCRAPRPQRSRSRRRHRHAASPSQRGQRRERIGAIATVRCQEIADTRAWSTPGRRARYSRETAGQSPCSSVG